MSEAVRLTVVPDATDVLPGELSLVLTVHNTGHSRATGHSGAQYRLDVSGIPAE